MARQLLGSPAAVVVRPEKLTLLRRSDTAPADHVAAAGVIREASYGGMFTRYAAALEGASPEMPPLQIVEQNLTPSVAEIRWARGSEVLVTFDRRHAHPIPDSSV